MTSFAQDLLRALDPVELCAAIRMVPDAWQVKALRSDHPRQLWNASRQAGKSQTAAVLAVHQATTVPNSTTLLVSPGQRQSSELAQKVRVLWRELALPKQGDNAMTLTGENGARVVSLPGSEGTIRGYTADLLILDEAARIEDDLYAAVRPMLAVTDGRLVAMSTPFGARGWWYEEWENGGATWERYRVRATDVPRISAAFLAQERASLGRWMFDQEYGTEFVSAQDQIFTNEDIARMLDQGKGMPGLFGGTE